MPVEIIIIGDIAAHALAELAGFSEALLNKTLPPFDSANYGKPNELVDEQAKVNATHAEPEKAPKPPKPAARGRKAKETPAPVVQEDSPEVQAQDAADEAAEAAAAAPAEPEKVFTYEDVRAALSGYVKKYGMAAVQEDGLKIYESIQPGAKKVSDFPADSAVLAKVVAAVEKIIVENPYNRPTVGA